MTELSSVVYGLGSESAVLLAIGIVLKCSVVTALGLLIAFVVSPSRSDLRNLVLRQVLLLGVVLPIITLSGLFQNLFESVAESTTWHIDLPSINAEAIPDVIGTATADTVWSVGAMVVLLMLSGCFVAILRIGYGMYLLFQIQRRSTTSETTAIVNIIEVIKSLARLDSAVEVRFTKHAIVPFTGGVLRHIAVLPETAKDWKRQELKMVLLHEFLHIKRRDSLWVFIGSLSTALNWYNPLVWLARRKMILEAERCCDAGVVADGKDASDYARLLVRLARSARDQSVNVAYSSQILGMKFLEVRIMSILQTKARFSSPSVGLQWSALLCTFLLLIPIAAMQLTGADRSTAGSTDKSGGATAADSANWPSPDEFVDVDSPPEIIMSGTPIYPDSLRRAGIEGSVWVRVLVDTSGTIARALVLETSGHKEMDDAALTAASKSIFKPALLNSKAVRLWVAYEIKFKLQAKKP